MGKQDIFSEQDVKRAMFGWRTKLWLWILPTHFYIQEGLAVYYKWWRGHYYFMKIEKEPIL